VVDFFVGKDVQVEGGGQVATLYVEEVGRELGNVYGVAHFWVKLGLTLTFAQEQPNFATCLFELKVVTCYDHLIG